LLYNIQQLGISYTVPTLMHTHREVIGWEHY